MERAVNSSSHFDSSTARPSLEISSSESVHNSCHGIKKSRRLTMEQVKALEKSFQLGNIPLEARRKEELAGALGLHPKQIAVWFQNRRARRKTKQLEKDLGVLKQEYESFKARYHTLLEENKTLQSEIQRLRSLNDQNKKDKEIMEDKQIDFNIVQEIKEEICCDVSNREDNIAVQQGSMEETCGQNILLAIEEDDCYYNMGERSDFMFVDDHWTPSFH